MKHFASVLALAGLVATGSAMAKPGDIYLLGHYTYSNFNGTGSLLENAETDTTSKSINQNHNRLGFGAGYVLNDTVSFELGYKNLGRAKGTYEDVSPIYSEYETIKASSQSLVLRAIGTYPITRELKLEGTAGLALTRSALKVDYNDNNGDYTHYNEHRTTLAPALGLGASYAFSDNLAVFSRYEYIHNGIDSHLLSDDDDDHKNDVGTVHASTFDLGLRYTF